jgi:hypothetical protein
VAYDAMRVNGGIVLHQKSRYGRQSRILRIGIGFIIRTFKLNANAEIIAVVTTLVARLPRVPGALSKIDKLEQLTGALYQQVRGNFNAPNLLEVRVLVPIQSIGEKALDTITAITVWRQRDIVNNQ